VSSTGWRRLLAPPAARERSDTGREYHAPGGGERGEVVLEDVADQNSEVDVYPEKGCPESEDASDKRPHRPDHERLKTDCASDPGAVRAERSEDADLAPAFEDLGR